MSCRCTHTYLCASCERRINAAESAEADPPTPDDYDPSWYDNAAERAFYPRQWS